MLESFRTHTGEIVKGKRLQDALEKVADKWASNARAIRENDDYAPHVTEEKKDLNLKRHLAYAEGIRTGENVNNFTIWQRVNTELTGDCVALPPK